MERTGTRGWTALCPGLDGLLGIPPPARSTRGGLFTPSRPPSCARAKAPVLPTERSRFRNQYPHGLFTVLWGSRVNLLTLFAFSPTLCPALLDAIFPSSNTGFCLLFADCCQAKDQYMEQFKDTLNTCVAKSIAGFFAEPIQVSILAWNTDWVLSYQSFDTCILEDFFII